MNGILLCSYHHHLVHAKDGPVVIREHEGDLFIVPTSWRGDPAEWQRRQSGRARDQHLDRIRRLRDPDRSPFAA